MTSQLKGRRGCITLLICRSEREISPPAFTAVTSDKHRQGLTPGDSVSCHPLATLLAVMF